MEYRKISNKNKIESYKRLKLSNIGHNFRYLTDDLYLELEKKGYEQLKFYNGNYETHAESTAVGEALELRRNGFYARTVCVTGNLRIKQYAVFFKKNK